MEGLSVFLFVLLGAAFTLFVEHKIVPGIKKLFA